MKMHTQNLTKIPNFFMRLFQLVDLKYNQLLQLFMLDLKTKLCHV